MEWIRIMYIDPWGYDVQESGISIMYEGTTNPEPVGMVKWDCVPSLWACFCRFWTDEMIGWKGKGKAECFHFQTKSVGVMTCYEGKMTQHTLITAGCLAKWRGVAPSELRMLVSTCSANNICLFEYKMGNSMSNQHIPKKKFLLKVYTSVVPVSEVIYTNFQHTLCTSTLSMGKRCFISHEISSTSNLDWYHLKLVKVNGIIVRTKVLEYGVDYFATILHSQTERVEIFIWHVLFHGKNLMTQTFVWSTYKCSFIAYCTSSVVSRSSTLSMFEFGRPGRFGNCNPTNWHINWRRQGIII